MTFTSSSIRAAAISAMSRTNVFGGRGLRGRSSRRCRPGSSRGRIEVAAQVDRLDRLEGRGCALARAVTARGLAEGLAAAGARLARIGLVALLIGASVVAIARVSAHPGPSPRRLRTPAATPARAQEAQALHRDLLNQEPQHSRAGARTERVGLGFALGRGSGRECLEVHRELALERRRRRSNSACSISQRSASVTPASAPASAGAGTGAGAPPRFRVHAHDLPREVLEPHALLRVWLFSAGETKASGEAIASSRCSPWWQKPQVVTVSLKWTRS